jgi:hypothetical protein
MWSIIKYTLITIVVSALTFLYLVYLGQNKISIMLNQGLDSLPGGLYDVSIKNRRGLYCTLTGFDADTDSHCLIEKQDLADWLKTAQFQVIIFTSREDSLQKFYTAYSSLPHQIINNTIDYTIQIECSNPKGIYVKPLDEKSVQLYFTSDWN